MLILLLGLAAHAQSIQGEVPALNAQHFRPSIDASRTLWVDDTTLSPRDFTGRVLVHYTRNPLAYAFDFGDTVEIVSDVLQADLTGGARFGPVRLGAHVPVYLYESGVNGTASGLGDLGVDGKVRLMERSQALGLALDGRLFFPTATVDTALGSPKTGWEVTAVADKDIGRVLLALNLGVRGGPAAELENIDLGNDLVLRAAGAYAITDDAGAALELAGGQSLAGFGNAAALPLEILASGYGYLSDGLVLRGGIGTGLTRGIGSPDLRVMVGIASQPRTERAAAPKVVEPVVVAQEPEPEAPVEPVAVAEPEPRVRISLVEGPQGDTPELRGADGEVVTLGPDGTADLSPGSYTLSLPAAPDIPASTLLVRGMILFATNDSAILPESRPVLDDVAIRVKVAGLAIRIEGHTDDRGSEASNLELSQRRAEAVRDYLVGKGVDPDRITVEAYGETRLLGNGKDRRVDIYSVP